MQHESHVRGRLEMLKCRKDELWNEINLKSVELSVLSELNQVVNEIDCLKWVLEER
jgi:hypothetical protein